MPVVFYGVKIYLDDVFTPDVNYGLTHAHGYRGWAEIGTSIIYGISGGTADFVVGRKVKVSVGFPSATELYTITAKTDYTLTIDAVATSTVHGDGITIDQQSELRWSERDYRDDDGLDWYGEWVTNDSIDAIEESGDLSRGGAPASYKGLSVSIKNTSREFELMRALGIFLPGKKAEVVRFTGYESTPGTFVLTDNTIIHTGTCEDPTWTETEFTVPIKNNLFKRNADMSTSITEGSNKDSIIPITFGTFIPDDPLIVENLSKFLRTDDTQDEDIYTNEFFTGTDPQIKIFPLYNKVSDTEYQIYTNGNVTHTVEIDVSNDNVYVFVKAGDGTGQIRQVMKFQFSGSPANHFQIVIKDVFYEELSQASDNTRSWLQIVKIDRVYMDDAWPCKAFLDEIGAEIQKAQLYSFADSKYNRIADYGFGVVVGTGKNTMSIDGQQYSEDIDKLKSFIILPVTSLERETTASLSQWPVCSSYTKVEDGVYKSGGATPVITGNTLSNAANAYDKDSDSFASYNPILTYGGTGLHSATVLKFGLPALPSNVKISTVYIGIKMQSFVHIGTWYDNTLHLTMRRFACSNSDDYLTFTKKSVVADDPNTDDLPDFYYDNAPSTNNINFYKSTSDTGSGWENIFGYTSFKLPNCGISEYNTYLEGAVILDRLTSIPGAWEFNNKIYELAIIFELEESDIKKEIFSPVKGRIFNDTWGARKTAINLIENPVDIIEHCKRLGNWNEFGKSGNYGKEYSTDAKIKISGEGSFDSSTLDDVKLCRPSFQVFDAREAWTNEIVKELCDTFGICSYIDKDGYECVKQLEEESSVETITLDDIVGIIDEIEEPSSTNIFCEPVLNYRYDYGREAFNKQLKVTNITAVAWQSSYTPGFEDIDGESFWNFCKRLYNEYGIIQQVPTDFSDKKMIQSYSDALYYLAYKLEWARKKRISLSVKYSKGMDYHFAQHVNIKLPHQTGDQIIECIIESVAKRKKDAKINLKLIILKSVTIYVVQDVAPGESPTLGIAQDHDIDLLKVYQDRAKGA